MYCTRADDLFQEFEGIKVFSVASLQQDRPVIFQLNQFIYIFTNDFNNFEVLCNATDENPQAASKVLNRNEALHPTPQVLGLGVQS